MPALFLFLMFSFNVICVFQGEAISEGVVASGTSATITGGCEKQGKAGSVNARKKVVSHKKVFLRMKTTSIPTPCLR
ncbi:hypothetical protein AAZX31_05G170800 [Glycine max]|uniref:Secreted protein n=2 Tax=Glycine subgen. Soja TaxID=1462606 RepID=K7KR10_SOYBN|nr:hypothetical protein JHK87_013245 [Glycine soja]KAG5155353.1 hypothetical protein JHK82_013322 [Glycine max]KAH1135088.1 hypothetical protein GYH30_013061 [Glycine max]KRH59433.1 hypothetical protein GLYMA_05G183000v4 [Glycine max]